MKDEVLILPHLEIGDNIVTNGACRVLARKHGKVAWAARHDHFDTISEMFSDDPAVRVVKILEYKYAETMARIGDDWAEVVRVGFFRPEWTAWKGMEDHKSWDRAFYVELGVDFAERWDSFSLPERMLTEKSRQRLVLIHERPEPARGYIIRPSLLPKSKAMKRMFRSLSFWDWMPEILNAEELHLVDSSYLNLAESLYGIGLLRDTRLVFHKYAKHNAHQSQPPTLRAPWEIHEK